MLFERKFSAESWERFEQLSLISWFESAERRAEKQKQINENKTFFVCLRRLQEQFLQQIKENVSQHPLGSWITIFWSHLMRVGLSDHYYQATIFWVETVMHCQNHSFLAKISFFTLFRGPQGTGWSCSDNLPRWYTECPVKLSAPVLYL